MGSEQDFRFRAGDGKSSVPSFAVPWSRLWKSRDRFELQLRRNDNRALT